MDNITELLVKKEKNGFDNFKKFGLFAGILIICLVAAIFLSGSAFLLPVWACFIFLGYKINDRFSVEFDYCLIEGSLDVDKVFSEKTRKKYLSIDQSTVELVAPLGDNALGEFSKLKTFYATNKNEDNCYVVVGVNNGSKCKVVIRGDEKLINQYKRCMPRKVIVK
ncbi:MAG: hypothetical protein J6A69_10390 [Clostridia bacterium]|nr:hypothetical protein [Clostridia bacterium]